MSNIERLCHCCTPGSGTVEKEQAYRLCVMVSDGPQGTGAPAEEGNNAPEVTHMSSSGQQVQGGALASSPAPSSASTKPPASSTATEDEDESEDESEILEESPCGRWQKRREEVTD